MDCVSPITLTKNLEKPLTVGCGKCYLCRVQKRREWTLRMLHEKTDWDTSMFLTLTYNDENLPMSNCINGKDNERVKDDEEVLFTIKMISESDQPDYDCLTSLRKKDLQDFLKRLRHNLGDRKIRYYACGEYGSKTNRPHYHLIIYGLSLSDEDKDIVKKSWSLCDWDNESISKNSFGIVTQDSIRYVAQYIDKKLSGDMAIAEYDLHGKEHLFSIQSKGLGKNYIDENLDQIYESGKITMNGHEQSFPRYYIKRMGLENSNFRSEKALKKQKKTVKKLTGVSKSLDEFYKTERTEDVLALDEVMKSQVNQKVKNLKAKANLKKQVF